MSLAVSLGLLSVNGLNLADTYFIASLGKDHLTAMGHLFPLIFTYFAISLALVIGTSTFIARKIGEQHHHILGTLIFHSMLLVITIMGTLMVAGYLTMDWLLEQLGASGNVLVLAREYTQIWLVGMFFLVIPVTGSGILRATGNIRYPTLLMLKTCTLNVILDPLLIFGLGPFPEWGIQGAAMASVIARAYALIAITHRLVVVDKLITLQDLHYSQCYQHWKSMMRIAIPATFGNMVQPVVITSVITFLAPWGNDAISAYAITSRIESFVYVLFIALSSTLSTYVSQNYGAQNIQRVRSCLLYALAITWIWGLLTTAICILMHTHIPEIFHHDPATNLVAKSYLLLVAIGYSAEGLRLITSASLYALDRSSYSMLIGGLKVLLIYGGCAIASTTSSWWGIFCAISAAHLCCGMVSLYVLKRTIAHKLPPSLAPSPTASLSPPPSPDHYSKISSIGSSG